MPAPTDSDLLRAYASRRDEPAFAALVSRYAGLVYGVAVRRVGTAAADEVVQNTFAKLAKRASELDASNGLAAWLHRVAQGEAANTVRKEQRRNQAMQRYAEQLDEPAADSELLPVLDEALVALGDPEQELVMMRFYESLSFREIGSRLGTSEEAGRKRLSRALDKLADAIGRKLGRSVPVAALAASLGVALTTKAPAGVIASAAATGVAAGAAGTSTIDLVALMKTSQVAFVSTLALAAALPVAVQWGAAAKSSPPGAAPTSTATGVSDPSSIRSATTPEGSAGTGFAPSAGRALDLNQLAADLAKIGPGGEPADLMFELTGKMFGLREAELAAVGDLLAGAPNAEHLQRVIDAYFSRWAEFDPRTALDATLTDRWKAHGGGNARIEAAQVWASSDPDAAVEWCEAQEHDIHGSILKMCVFRHWAIADPHAALAKTHELPADRGSSYRRELLLVWVHHEPEAALDWAGRVDDETERTRMIEYVIENLSQQSAAKGFAMASELEDPILRADSLRYALMQWRFSQEEAARGFLSLPEADRTNELATDVLGWLRIEHLSQPEDPETLLEEWLAGRETQDTP